MISRARLLSALAIGALLSSPALALTSADFTFDPKLFNVYSNGNIGSTGQPYGSDFEGIAGVKGDFNVSGFSLHDIAAAGPNTGISLYAGGNAVISGQINNGGIAAGGNVAINGTGVSGNLNAGGNLSGTGGSITGNATLGGQKLVGPSVTVLGTLTENTPYTAPVNFNNLSQYFSDISDTFGGMVGTTSATDQWGELLVPVNSGLNVLNLTAAEFNPAWGLTLNGPADAKLVINIADGGSISLDQLVFNLGSVPRENVLINIPNATSLVMSGGGWVSMLAIKTDVTFTSGVLIGNLITDDLMGGGQVNTGYFSHYDLGAPPPNEQTENAIPEPTTAALSLMAGASLLVFRRRSSR